MDVAVSLDLIKKSGAWFSYKEERIGQGRENAKQYLKDHPEMYREIEEQVMAQVKNQDLSSFGDDDDTVHEG